MPLACLGRVSDMNIWDEVMCLHHNYSLEIPDVAANYVAVLTKLPVARIATSRKGKKPSGYWQKIVIARCNSKTFTSWHDIAEGFSKQEHAVLFGALHSLRNSGVIERCGKCHHYQYRLRN